MDKWQKRMEKVTANAVWRALQKQKNDFQKYLREVGLPNDAEIKRILGYASGGVVEAFIKRSKTTLDRAYKNAGKSGPVPLIGIDWNLPAHPARHYIDALKDLHLSERKGSITVTTEERVKKLVRDSLKDGMSRADIAKNIEKLDPQVFSKNRAELIAINQIHKAQNYGEYIARKEFHDAGYLVLKYWSTANDNRVTRTHTANQSDGWKGFEKTFSGTGDTIPPASDNPRCRCVLKYEIGELRGEKQPKDIEQKLIGSEKRKDFEKTFSLLRKTYKKDDDILMQKMLKNYEGSFAEDIKISMPEGTTKEESIAFLRWKSSDYFYINEVFRDKKIHSQYAGMVLELKNALDNFPLYRGEVFRGISHISTIQELEQFEKGDIFMDPGFMSSSTDKKVAKRFGNNIMKIQSKTGRNLGKADRLNEKEILFAPATQLVFDKKVGDIYYFNEL